MFPTPPATHNIAEQRQAQLMHDADLHRLVTVARAASPGKSAVDSPARFYRRHPIRLVARITLLAWPSRHRQPSPRTAPTTTVPKPTSTLQRAPR